ELALRALGHLFRHRLERDGRGFGRRRHMREDELLRLGLSKGGRLTQRDDAGGGGGLQDAAAGGGHNSSHKRSPPGMLRCSGGHYSSRGRARYKLSGSSSTQRRSRWLL